jgi:hypothetical protein
MISPSERFYHPGGRRDDRIASRKERFEQINEFVRSRGGWLVSVPGAAEVSLGTLPGSSLPDKLRGLGYDVREGDPPTGERILHSAIIERLARNANGELVPSTAGSTLPVIEIEHAGIIKVQRHSFGLP